MIKIETIKKQQKPFWIKRREDCIGEAWKKVTKKFNYKIEDYFTIKYINDYMLITNELEGSWSIGCFDLFDKNGNKI